MTAVRQADETQDGRSSSGDDDEGTRTNWPACLHGLLDPIAGEGRTLMALRDTRAGSGEDGRMGRGAIATGNRRLGAGKDTHLTGGCTGGA